VLTRERLDLLPPGTLVKYRGMVQDMLNPEFYLGVYQHKSPTGETVPHPPCNPRRTPKNLSRQSGER